MSASDHLSGPQFYHGSPVRFSPGDQVTSPVSRNAVGANHDYLGANRTQDHTFFSSSANEASTFNGTSGWSDTPNPDDPGYVYKVKPTGAYEPDEGFNNSSAFKSKEPLTVTGIHSVSPPFNVQSHQGLRSHIGTNSGYSAAIHKNLSENQRNVSGSMYASEVQFGSGSYRNDKLEEASSQRIQDHYNKSIQPYKGVE